MSFLVKIIVLIAGLGSVTSQIAVLPPLRQLGHSLQSGIIEVLNNTTLLVHDFYYDGLSPSAHFRVGRGDPSATGVPVPVNGSYAPLSLHSGEYVRISLPSTSSFDKIDYLAVWCNTSQTTFGYVLTNERWLEFGHRRMIFPTVLHPLRSTSNEVSSDVITLLDQRTISIKSLYYDGKGTSTHFRVGIGNPSINSTLLATESGTGTLPKYQGKDTKITLPNQISLIDFDYFMIWDDKNGSFGHVYLNDVYTDPTEFAQYIGTELEGFDIPEYKLRSGPIIVVTRKKLYVTNFHSPDLKNVYLQVGANGKPTKTDYTLPNQYGDNDYIKESKGMNFYITLPDSFDITGDKNLAIFNKSGNGTSQDYITFNAREARSTVNPLATNDGRRIIRYPKCCPDGQMMPYCSDTDLKLDNSIPVHFANSSHLNDARMVPERLLFVPYHSNPTCSKYALYPNDDNFLMLSTGKFIFSDLRQVHTPDEYCLDMAEDEDGFVQHTAFICTAETTSNNGYRIAVMICIAISAVSLFLTAATYFMINNSDDKRGASLAGFSGFMGLAFVSLFITQIGYEGEHPMLCKILGFIFQFFIVSSLIWLDALCFEVLYYIKYYRTDEIVKGYKKRLIIYFVCSLVIPLIFVIISLALHLPVGLMNINLDQPCHFQVDDQKWLLYSPILLTVLISIGITIYTYQFYYTTNEKNAHAEGMEAADWRLVRPDIRRRDPRETQKKVLMLCVFLVALTGICWIFEIVTYVFDSPWQPLDVLHALQGLFTLLVVLSTGNIFEKFKDSFCCVKKKTSANESESQPMTDVVSNGTY